MIYILYRNGEGPKGLDKVDCQDLIFQTNREIKTLNYKLMRIIATESVHQVLFIGRNNDIEIIEE